MSVLIQFTGCPAHSWFSWLRSAAAILVVFGLAACSGEREDAEPGYPLTGEILEIIPEKNVLVVRHDEIPDYMPAMTMEFSVSAGDLANASVGQHIRARLIENEGTFSLERIWPSDRLSTGIIEQNGKRLMEDTVIRGSKAFREVGETIPGFALFDQTGQVVQTDRFRGKKLVLNFIYTRCPVPEMCPAATQRMIQLQKAAEEAGVENLELVSITLDPDHDTPGVLRQYAKNLGIDTSNFSFLTGPESAIANLMEQFGILVDPQQGFSSHTLGTIVVDESGTIIHRVFGSNWMVGDFLDRLKSADLARNDGE